jgi:hypothetical protein
MTAKTVNKFMFYSIMFTLIFTVLVSISALLNIRWDTSLPLYFYIILAFNAIMLLQEIVILILYLTKRIRLYNPIVEDFVAKPKETLITE